MDKISIRSTLPVRGDHSREQALKQSTDLPTDQVILQNHSVAFTPARSLELQRLAAKSQDDFATRYGPWGVVTGASQGIGVDFARSLASRGLNVVLVARGADKLEKVADDIREDYGVDVKVVAADIATPTGLDKVKKDTASLDVGMLVNNAGTWQFGSFLDNQIDRDVASIALNVEAPMVLTHHFGNLMADRGRGGVINVGSGAALHGVPGQAAYSATKGFLQNFTASLYRELKPKGIDILITDPGPVEGKASSVYDQSKVPLQMVSPHQVAEDALNNLGKRSTTIPGWLNKLAIGAAVRVMPRDMLSGVAGWILGKASENPTVSQAAPLATASQGTAAGTATSALLATAQESAQNAASGVLGHLWGAVTRPLKSVAGLTRFALDFVGSLSRRAEEISTKPGEVEKTLRSQGLYHDYQEPVNQTNTKFRGKMVIKANMAEFFQLWNSWISKGYGSINDRQYADQVLRLRNQAQNLPLLAHIPMTSSDAFSCEVREGKMTGMRETTTTKLAGLIPTSRVEWLYTRKGDPTGSNSFEQTIDRFNGDLDKVQAFYNDLFDPQHVIPGSKATVTFTIEPTAELPELEVGDKEFIHSVNVPAGRLLPRPESTLVQGLRGDL